MKKRNRKLRKVLLTLCCAMALVAISVGATLAYLTDTEAVTNVFTVGQVGISLDEAKTDTDGEKILDEGNEIRINNTNSGRNGYSNEYHLVPGESYTKDPTVHVDANSEPSWLFVKVENDLENIEDKAAYTNMNNASTSGTIKEQMEAFGWQKLDGVDDVYYQPHATKSAASVDYPVFKAFKLIGEGLVNGTKPAVYDGDDKYIGDYATATVKVTAYAIQMAGFEDKPADAWAAGKWN